MTAERCVDEVLEFIVQYAQPNQATVMTNFIQVAGITRMEQLAKFADNDFIQHVREMLRKTNNKDLQEITKNYF